MAAATTQHGPRPARRAKLRRLAVVAAGVSLPLRAARPPRRGENGGVTAAPWPALSGASTPPRSAARTTRRTAARGHDETRRRAPPSGHGLWFRTAPALPSRGAVAPRRRSPIVGGVDPGSLRRQRNAPNGGAGTRVQCRAKYHRRRHPGGGNGGATGSPWSTPASSVAGGALRRIGVRL